MKSFELGDIVHDFEYDQYYLITHIKQSDTYKYLYSLMDLEDSSRVIGASLANLKKLYKKVA